MNSFSAEPCLIKLISLGRWATAIVTELLLYKTITIFQCILQSEHFTMKEANMNTVFSIFWNYSMTDYIFCCTLLFFFIHFHYNFIYKTIISAIYSFFHHSSEALKQLIVIYTMMWCILRPLAKSLRTCQINSMLINFGKIINAFDIWEFLSFIILSF